MKTQEGQLRVYRQSKSLKKKYKYWWRTAERYRFSHRNVEKTLIDLQKAFHTSSRASIYRHNLLELNGKQLVNKSMIPPTFDGVIHWPNYRSQFEKTAGSNHECNEEKPLHLFWAFSGKDLTILPNIPIDRQKVVTTRLTKSLKKKEDSKSWQEYEADIERLVRLVYPEAPEQFAHQLEVSGCMKGVRDIQIY